MHTHTYYFHNDFCGQDYLTQFVHEGIRYSSLKQWMVAKKASYFGDFCTHFKVMSNSNTNWINFLGTQIKPTYYIDVEQWNCAQFQLAVLGNYLKFSQNSMLLSWLLQTKYSDIIHAPPEDRIWGEGLLIYDANSFRAYANNNNFEGNAIMQARKYIQEKYITI
jgi:ribA/ribD-fused uncharacterized protein